ncbi:hypothetical protein [Effusibacillus consociatus]|uniref:Uncharacterized protein n=1 Tax=Effusibacillus consociatus TaxID=1117041 RepID=A0ABV9Q099_9BACL
MSNVIVKPMSGSEQFEEFGIFLDEGQIGNLFVHYNRGTATVDGSVYLTSDQSKDQFLTECSEELFPELLNRGVHEINSMGLTIYQNQQIHQEELPSPTFRYGHPNSW